MTYSMTNSELQTWVRCKRKWYLGHYLRYAPDPANDRATGMAQLGTRVHSAMEELYGSEGDPEVYLDAVYDAAVATNPEEEDDLEKERSYALAMVRGYRQWAAEEGIDEGLELLGAEDEIEVESGYPGVRLRAKLDQRLRRRDGAELGLDFKTVGDLTGPVRVLHINEQAKFYTMLQYLRSNGERFIDGMLWRMLRRVKRTDRSKPPYYHEAEVKPNREELRSMYLRTYARIEEIMHAWRKLDEGGDHRYHVYPTPQQDCAWSCPFFKVCPLMDDGSAWRELLDAAYVKHDPYARYHAARHPGDDPAGA